MLFFEGEQNGEEADAIFERTRRGMARISGRQMVEGRARLGVPHKLPPGFLRIRLRAGTRAGDSMLYLESPDVLPPRSEVTTGYPDVVDEAGEVVDQVATVRYILRRLAEGDAQSDIAAAAVERRFSSSTYRERRNDPAAFWGPERLRATDGGNGILRGILDNLDVYETGVLSFRLGSKSDQAPDFAITGCFPPDGPWLDAAGWAKLRARMAITAARRAAWATLTFVGLTGTLDDGATRRPFVLNYSGATDIDRYTMVDAERYPNGVRSLTPARIPADELARAIVEGLAAAGDTALHLVHVDGDDEATRPHRARIAELDRTLTGLDAQLRGIREAVQDPALAAMKSDLNADYERIAAERAVVGQQLSTARAELEKARVERRGTSRADLAVEGLLTMIATLRDSPRLSATPATERTG